MSWKNKNNSGVIKTSESRKESFIFITGTVGSHYVSVLIFVYELDDYRVQYRPGCERWAFPVRTRGQITSLNAHDPEVLYCTLRYVKMVSIGHVGFNQDQHGAGLGNVVHGFKLIQAR